MTYNCCLLFAWSNSKPITIFVDQMVHYLSPSYRKLQEVFACHHVYSLAKKCHNNWPACLTLYELCWYSATCHDARAATSLLFLPRACLTKRQVLSRELKKLVRKMIMTGVYLTEPLMNNKMKQNDKQCVKWYRNFTVTFTCLKTRCE